MIERLIDILTNWASSLAPFVIVNPYEEGVLNRAGKFKKVVSPGIHFKIPLIDEIITQYTVMTTLSLPAQSLYTIDKQNIVVKGVVKYKISDVKIFLLEVYDAKDVISDMAQSIIKNIIMSKTMEECIDSEIDNTLTKKVRAEVKKWGVEVNQVTLTDLAPIRSFRLINDVISNKLD